ncbi:MarR family winged helix-turn-helix transcriptional regulator [Lacrimispora celerecrescens]|uniref:DNA-binding MarR family transcriptional regulator n=1 Tax=[Clostridium] celerecrescens 18A TaxID=1286362 RepID=A0A2M8ZBI8_9FIRM|nr:MarR family transcriptional regulator [Lacrimispora celerecrescens]PJJ30812.1 DNA-binding MarR family transcriptional regulator [[Clostridium] celerecrescens 18A]
MDPKTDNQNEYELFHMVAEINEITYSMNARLMKERQSLFNEDLTSKQTIIMDLVKKESQLSISQLAEAMNVTSSAVSQIVSKLEKEKYLLRAINPDNRREIIVQLDEKGHHYYAKEEEINREIVNRFYSRMKMEDMIQLRDILQKLNLIVEEELSR